MISIYETSLGTELMLERLAFNAVYYDHELLVKGLCDYIDTFDMKHVYECDCFLSYNTHVIVESFNSITRTISPQTQQAAKDHNIDIDIFSSGLDMGATQEKKVRDAANDYIRGNKKGLLHRLIDRVGKSKAASFITNGLSKGIRDKLIKKGQRYAAKLVLKGKKNISAGSSMSAGGLTDMVHGMQKYRNHPKRTKVFSILGMIAPVLTVMPLVKQISAVQKLLKKIPTKSIPSPVYTGISTASKAGKVSKVFGKMSSFLSPKYRMVSGHTKALKGGKQVALGKHLYKQFNKLKR